MRDEAPKKSRKTLTIRRWYFLTTAALFLPVMLAVLLASSYAGVSLRGQAVDYNQDILSLYMERLEAGVRGVERFLGDYPYENSDISTLALSSNERDRYLAADNILRDLAKTTQIYDSFDGLYVYSRSSIQDLFLCKTGGNATGAQITAMRALAEDMPGQTLPLSWFIHRADDESYLVRVINRGTTWCGAWVNAKSLMLPLDRIDFGQEGMALFTDMDGMPLTFPDGAGDLPEHFADGQGEITAGGVQYLQIEKSSSVMPVTLRVLLPNAAFSGPSRAIQLAIITIFLLALAAVPFIGSFFSRRLYRPLDSLSAAMQVAEKGDLTVRIPQDGRLKELNAISSHFNHMVEQIQRLEQDVYVRTIREQKTQLDYLHLQIKPHFFLNVLNVVYSFALVKRYDLIEKMVIHLTQYFRYIFISAVKTVALQDEIGHVENYMEIQALRYPGNFLFSAQVQLGLERAAVPPLVIQTFIENSVKYALELDSTHAIGLQALWESYDGVDRLKIVISDNGKGYPLDFLQRALDEPPQSGDGKGIGIWNARQRLKLIYGEEAWIHLYNKPQGGAVSEILLPFEAWQPQAGTAPDGGPASPDAVREGE